MSSEALSNRAEKFRSPKIQAIIWRQNGEYLRDGILASYVSAMDNQYLDSNRFIQKASSAIARAEHPLVPMVDRNWFSDLEGVDCFFLRKIDPETGENVADDASGADSLMFVALIDQGEQIIDHETGQIVESYGPDFTRAQALLVRRHVEELSNEGLAVEE